MASEAVSTPKARISPQTEALYEKVKDLIPPFEWAAYAPLIDEINALKKTRRAVILAHNYQTPEIFHGVADITGDSLALANRAVDAEADVIVLCGVHFMAETAKIINPERTVIIPDLEAGCSLAASITGQDVRGLREKHPGVPIVTYVNTSAEVKAESDICCTSANAIEVVESLGSDRVIMIPDEFLAAYVARHTDVEIIPWNGRCEVHEQFTAGELRSYREQFPSIVILAHPECPGEVLDEADMVGSTSGMIRYLHDSRPEQVALITECSMSDNVAAEFPETRFVRPCTICPHMKTITLEKILHSLKTLEFKVEVDPEVAVRAKQSVERMLAVGRGAKG